MNVREEILQAYAQSRAAMTAHLEVIDKNRKIYPLWTIREIIAHLSGWDDASYGMLSALIKGETPHTPATRGASVYNEETVSTREGLSYDHIVREYVSTRERLLDLVRSAPEETLTQISTLPWGDESSFETMAKFLASHELEHAEDVRKLIEEESQKQRQG